MDAPNGQKFTPGEWGAILALATAAGGIFWKVVEPTVVWAGRQLGKRSFKHELGQLGATATTVSLIQTDGLPRIERIATDALETAQRTEESVKELHTVVRQFAEKIGEVRGAQQHQR